MVRSKGFARTIVTAILVVAFGVTCSALGWGVANAAYAVGRYVGAH